MDLIDKYLQQEEMKSDTGWKKAETERKDQYGNRIKRVAKSLAKQGMQAAIKDLKKGPEAGKRQVEEVEELDELKQDTLNKYITRTRFSSDPKRRMGAQRAMAKVGQKPKEEKQVTEEIEDLDELKQDTGLPYGFKEEVELEESLKNKLAAMGVAATMAASPAAARVTDGGQSFAQQTAQQTTQPQSVKAPKEIPSKSYLQNVASGKSRSMMHPDTAKEMLKKHYSEEVDLVSKYSKLGEVYDRSNMMSRSGFKSREMSTELGHEDDLPHSVHITNSSGQKKKWKTFSNRPQAEKAASTLRAKGVTAHASIG